MRPRGLISRLVRLATLSITVASNLDAQPSGPMLHLVPTRTISAAREGMGMPNGWYPLSNGGIASRDYHSHRLYFFDQSFRRIVTAGGLGSGPGEFREISRVGGVGDSIWAWDMASRRVTVFSNIGKLIRTHGFPVGALRLRDSVFTTLSDPYVYGVYRQRLLVRGVPTGASRRASGYWYAIVTPGRDSVDWVIAQVPRDFGIPVPSAKGSRRVPFSHEAKDAVASNGRFLAIVQTVTMVGAQVRVRITLVRPVDGVRLYPRDFAFSGTAISQRMKDSAMAASLERVGDPLERTAVSALRSKIPGVLDPILNMFVARDGAVWLQVRQPKGEERRWLIIGMNGEPRGEVRIGRDIYIKDATDSTVWATAADQDGFADLHTFLISTQRVPSDVPARSRTEVCACR